MPWIIRSADGSYFGIDNAVLIDVSDQENFQHAIDNDLVDEYLEELHDDGTPLSELLADHIKSEGA